MNQFDTRNILKANIDAAREMLATLNELAEPLDAAAGLIHAALAGGHKLLCCGNGGSACDSAHFVGEIVGRFVRERGYPAIDLTSGNATMTALINDYPPERLFARQVEALGAPGDVLVAFTTSGKSANIVKALEAARAKGVKSVAFLGRDGGTCKGMADVELLVRAITTRRIQEGHMLLYHAICEVLDPVLDA